LFSPEEKVDIAFFRVNKIYRIIKIDRILHNINEALFSTFFCGNPSTPLRSSKKSHRKTLPAGQQGYTASKKIRDSPFSEAAMVNGCTTVASAFTIRKVIFNAGIIKVQVFQLYSSNIY
jgi:hypothetical protein